VAPLPNLENITSRLTPFRPAPGQRRQAAVAAILREDRGRLEVLLMQRAPHPRDPWSGDTCMPGGHWSRGDANLFDPAVRETREEVGLDLSAIARLLGVSETVRPMGPFSRMLVQPFVFALTRDAQPQLGSEAVGVFWLPLDAAANGTLDDRYLRKLGPFPIRFACWRFEERVVWGLTLKMLQRLLGSA